MSSANDFHGTPPVHAPNHLHCTLYAILWAAARVSAYCLGSRDSLLHQAPKQLGLGASCTCTWLLLLLITTIRGYSQVGSCLKDPPTLCHWPHLPPFRSHTFSIVLSGSVGGTLLALTTPVLLGLTTRWSLYSLSLNCPH